MKPLVIRFGPLLLCFIASGLLAAPVNDLFVNRTILAGTNVSVAGSNIGATEEPGEDIGNFNILYVYSVWYAWTAPTNGVVHLSGSTTAPNFFMSVRVYRGPAVNALTPAATTPDGGVPVTAGDTIVIQVASIYYAIWGGGGATGPFTLSLSLELPTPTSLNDAFANRLEITKPTYHFDGSLYGATSEPGEPLPSGTSQTLWWKFTAPEEGVLALWPAAPQFTPVLMLYTGETLASLAPVSPLNGYRFAVQAGQTYALQLAAGYVPAGAFALDARFFARTNDFFAGSTQLEGTNLTYVGNLSTATPEAGEPDSGYPNTIWVSWAAPFSGRARFSRTIVAHAQPVQPYIGPTLDRLQPVRFVGMDNGRYDFLAVAGTVYHFQISGIADECTLSLQLFPWTPATNDFFATAHPATGQQVNPSPEQGWFAVADATAEIGEPAHLGVAAFKSLWWKWTAPVHGTARFWAERSLATNIVVAAYKGNAVEALSLLAKGTNNVSFPVNGGDRYYLAAAVPTNALGDVLLYGGVSAPSSASRLVPGNLLREPSWEGTGILDAQYWKLSGDIGGYVNEGGGADGTTWPVLGSGAKVWQDFATAPGMNHVIRFAYLGSGAQVRVTWDDRILGVATSLPDAGYWHWAEFFAYASNTTSRLTFQNLGALYANVHVDAFSAVPLSASPLLVRQPVSASVMAGGTVAFAVGVEGSPPLNYAWYHDNSLLVPSTNAILVLESVGTNQAGTYQAIISSPFGAVTSAPVTLVVNAPTKPVILWQPYGDTVGVGGAYTFGVAAAGTLPLRYQWFVDGTEITGATNRDLIFAAVALSNAGIYSVRVDNPAGIVWSLGAPLKVTAAVHGGGLLWFNNDFYSLRRTNVDAPVFDIDGVTPLNGSNYLAQLYGGPSLETLRPLGLPSPFRTGFRAGYFYSQVVTLPTVPPGSNAIVQVRAWETGNGTSYEAARALGGKFGKSELLTVMVGGGLLPPMNLEGLQSFSLGAGMPQYTYGEIQFVERQPGNLIVWSHRGAPGFRYLIEKSIHGFEWHPFVVVTNLTDTVTFTDSAQSGSGVVFYRSRILD